MGSKARHAADIIAVTCADRKPGQAYVEPFVGGGNVICKVPQAGGPRVASDVNKYMVALLDVAGNKGWLPPESMTKTEWGRIKKNQDNYAPELVAFAATGPTFGSKWMDEWANDYEGKEGTRYRQARDAVIRDASGLQGIVFYSLPYDQLTPHIPPGSIVYCDPPYSGTEIYTGAKTKIKIDESLSKNRWKPLAFWKWADALVEQGHKVYVSEYSGPPSGIYNGTSPELKAERAALGARYKASAEDPTSPQSVRDELYFAIADVDKRIQANADALAARWEVLWSKEVVSDFSATRTEDNGGKREVEKLFHRRPG